MWDVFISYSSKDRPRVQRLVERLREKGVAVWWDDGNLPPGQRWDDEIERGLNESSKVVILWSEASIQSEEVKDEAYLARDLGKALPVRIENVRPPYRFLRIQGFDLIHEPLYEAPIFPRFVDAVRGKGPMRRVDEGDPQDDALVDKIISATQSTKPARHWHLIAAPILIVAGLATILAGQFLIPDAPADWPTWLGVSFCGLAFASAFAISLSRAG